MAHAPAPWQLNLARIEGALPFMSPEIAEGLALASLRQLWRVHVRDYAFENIGPAHNPGPEAAELMRSWYASERQEFLSWLVRRAPPPLAQAARTALAAKGLAERYTQAMEPADRALERLDALLPAQDPVSALRAWIQGLRGEENDFLEGGSEEVLAGGRVFYRFAPRGTAWAASLAAAVRPHVFGLGTAPVAFAGLAPREVFRESRERSSQVILAETLDQAARAVADDLMAVHGILRMAAERLAGLYASSQAPAVWKLVACLGPLTRAEVARALGVTRRTASQAAVSLAGAGLAHLRDGDQVLAASELVGPGAPRFSARL